MSNHHILTYNRNRKIRNRHRKPIPPTGYAYNTTLKVGDTVVGFDTSGDLDVPFIGEIIKLFRYVGTVRTPSGVVLKIGRDAKTRGENSIPKDWTEDRWIKAAESEGLTIIK